MFNTNSDGIPVANKHNWYIPAELMLRGKINWKTDYTADIMHQVDMTTRRLDWISDDLSWFKEPLLSQGYGPKAYRLLWLRTFDPPVVIRMERTKNDVFIYWKIPPPPDSLNPHPAPVEFKKKLRLRDWKKFEKSVNGLDYWTMMPAEYTPKSTDGALWLLEAAVDGKYQFTMRPGDIYHNYTECLISLINLTDLKIPEDRIY